MCVGSPTAGTWSSSQWQPDDEFETDRRGRDATGRRPAPPLRPRRRRVDQSQSAHPYADSAPVHLEALAFRELLQRGSSFPRQSRIPATALTRAPTCCASPRIDFAGATPYNPPPSGPWLAGRGRRMRMNVGWRKRPKRRLAVCGADVRSADPKLRPMPCERVVAGGKHDRRSSQSFL
jgi:hypothetical protein